MMGRGIAHIMAVKAVPVWPVLKPWTVRNAGPIDSMST